MTVRLKATIDKYIGLATDTKPTSAPIGSEFYEYDTLKTYICYDGASWAETNNFWAEYYLDNFLSEMQ